MSVSSILTLNLDVTETFVAATAGDAAPFVDANTNSVKHNGLDAKITRNGTTNPGPASIVATKRIALIAGAFTLDLTALPRAGGGTQSANGMKLQHIMVKAAATNANPISMTVGAANGYPVLGTSGLVSLSPGQQFGMDYAAIATTVDGTHKNIDFAGTGTQEIDVILVFG